MKKPHQCKQMELAEAWISCSSDGWYLNINRIATEENLEQNHHLEEVGETMEHVVLQIRYCPYCGALLDEGNDKFMPSFTHDDFSR